MRLGWEMGRDSASESRIGSHSVGNDSPLFSTGNLTSSTLYWVLVGNDGGSVPSEAALVTVLDPVPVITGQPQDLDVVSGETVEFAVTATGPNLNYQWFNGAPPDTSDPVVGATSPIFAVGPLTEITSYWVQVSNSGATVNSVAATAFIVDLPEILVQPDSVSIFSEEQATLVVTAISADAPTYQWYQGTSPNEENPLVGETADSIVTAPLTTTTSYWVKVANAAGETFSDTAVVTVGTLVDLPTATFPPEIIAQPTSTVIPQGGSTSLAVAANSLGDPTFQWFRGLSGDESDPVEGATSTVLDTGPLDVTTTYWVKVTNAAGSADSEAATVEVTVL